MKLASIRQKEEYRDLLMQHGFDLREASIIVGFSNVYSEHTAGKGFNDRAAVLPRPDLYELKGLTL